MIVVGFLAESDGLALDVARRAAESGARVEMVGAAAPDPAGDRRLVELATAGVGHATVIRTGSTALEPADLDLALRYLPDIRCLVVVRPAARLVPTALTGSEWSGATLVVVGPLDVESVEALDAAETRGTGRPIVLDPPSSDPDGTFAGFVAALAVRLDAGDAPEVAFRSTLSNLAADPV